MDPAPHLVGRSSQQAQLLGSIAAAAGGQPSATLLHGEPGIGKTSVVRDLVGRAEARHLHVLFGQCLRFGSEVTTYQPFTRALDHWVRGAGQETVARVFPGAASARDILGTGQGVPGRPQPMSFTGADAVERLADDGPTLLVMDDLQWADPSSLDLLSFIVAGLHAGQRLAVIVTYRDTELGEGHRLHGWLADVLRLSHVERCPLSRLTAAETEQLVAGLPGVSGALAQAEDVYQRSDGNPYLAELLAHEVEGGAGRSGALNEALLGSWHRLSLGARSTTQVVAVAGRPVDLRVLGDVTTGRGQRFDDVAGAVTEAVGNGVLTLQTSGEVWFHHPLLAEVIAGTLLPWQVTELHRALRCGLGGQGGCDAG